MSVKLRPHFRWCQFQQPTLFTLSNYYHDQWDQWAKFYVKMDKKKYSFHFLALWNIRSFWTNARTSRNKSIRKFHFSISTLKHVCPHRMKTRGEKIDLSVIPINCNDNTCVTKAMTILHYCWPDFWCLFWMILICLKFSISEIK